MKIKNCNLVVKPIVYAMSSACIPILFSMFRGLGWEKNDDIMIAWFLSRGDHWCLFQAKLLCNIFGRLYETCRIIDWWSVMTIATIYIALSVILYVVYRKEDNRLKVISSIVIELVVWCTTLRCLNFTRTAFIISFAGIALIYQSVMDKTKKKLFWSEIIFGTFFLLYGTMLRLQCGIIALGYLLLILSGGVIKDILKKRDHWYKRKGINIILICIMPLVFVIHIAINNVMLTDEQKEYKEYNSYRSDFFDFKSLFPPYYSALEEYQRIGISEMEYDYFPYLTEDTDMFTMEKLSKLSKMKGNNRRIKDVFDEIQNMLFDSNYNSWMILLLVVIIQVGIVMLNHSMLINILILDSILTVVVMANAWMSHFVPRVFEPVVAGTLIMSIIMVEESVKMKSLLCTYSIVISVIAYIVFCQYINKMPIMDGVQPWIIVDNHQQVSNRYLELINEDKENIYIFPLEGAPAWWTTAYKFGDVMPIGYCENMFCLGGWDARAPYNKERLKKYGISNPMKALFERNDVYSVYDPDILAYLRENYEHGMTASGIRLCYGILYVQYTKHIDITNIQEENDATIVITQVSNRDNRLYIHGKIEGAFAKDTELFCNVSTMNQTYTYKLGVNNQNEILGVLYDVPDQELEIIYFEKTDTGNYKKINKKIDFSRK